jgi:hypothetical protein
MNPDPPASQAKKKRHKICVKNSVVECTGRSALSIFNAEPDPALYVNRDPVPVSDPDLGSQTNADPRGSGSWSDFAVTKS